MTTPKPAARAAKPAAAKPAAAKTTAATAAAKKPAAKPVAKKPVAAKPAAKPAAPKTIAAPAAAIETNKRYKMLTGIDDSEFCQKVSDHLDAGYELYGSPAATFNGKNVIVAQAVVLKKLPKKGKRK